MDAPINLAEVMRLDRNMRVLPVKIEQRVSKAAMRKGGNVIAKDARKRARKKGRTGTLAKSIGVKAMSFQSGNASAIIGPRKAYEDTKLNHKPVNIAHLVELGTKPHEIVASRTGFLGLGGGGMLSSMNDPWKDGKPQIFGRRVTVSAPAQPYLEPAYTSKKAEAYTTIARAMEEGAHREAAKLGAAR